MFVLLPKRTALHKSTQIYLKHQNRSFWPIFYRQYSAYSGIKPLNNVRLREWQIWGSRGPAMLRCLVIRHTDCILTVANCSQLFHADATVRHCWTIFKVKIQLDLYRAEIIFGKKWSQNLKVDFFLLLHHIWVALCLPDEILTTRKT